MNNFKKEFDDIMGDFVNLSDSITYVCFVMDHSGSMESNADRSLSNFNEYLATVQKEADKQQTVVTVIEFDDNIKMPIKNILAENVQESDEYWIGNTTALYDAIGQGIGVIRGMMDNDPREDKAAIFFINTDGWENASKDFSQEKIIEMIKELEDTEKWTFTFLAEGIDKSVVGNLSAMAAGNTVSFDKSKAGYKMSLESTVRGVQSYYSARAMGDTQVSNFHDNGSGAMKIKTPRTPKLTESEENEAKFREIASLGVQDGNTGGGEHGNTGGGVK